MCDRIEKVRTGPALIIVKRGWWVDVDSKCCFLHYSVSLKFSIIEILKDDLVAIEYKILEYQIR